MLTYIHATAKHRRSGTTMQTHMSRGAIEKYEAARVVKPGYPITTKFTCREQVDAYLTGERITCLLCGKDYRALAPHVKRIHQVDASDYKWQFGIPQCRGLYGEGKTEAATKFWKSAEARHLLEKMMAANKRTPKEKIRAKVSFVQAEAIARIVAVNDERIAAGGANPQAKLTAEQVSEIRASKEANKVLRERFGVSRSTIKRLRRGEGWQYGDPR